MEMQREERARKIEEKIDRELREGEGNGKKSGERLKTLEVDRTGMENEVKEMAKRTNKYRKETEIENVWLQEVMNNLRKVSWRREREERMRIGD
jgi:hypothetical protein